MDRLLINQVPIEIINPEVNIYLSGNDIENFEKRDKANLFGKVYSNKLKEALKEIDGEVVFTSFNKNNEVSPLSINLFEDRYFIKPFIQDQLKKYFRSKEMIVCENFINDLEIWLPQDSTEVDSCKKFITYSIKIVNAKSELSILLSLGNERHIYQKPINQIESDTKKYLGKVLFKNEVISYKKNQDNIYQEEAYPIINRKLQMALELNYTQKKKFRNIADYNRYFNAINQFYEAHLKGQVINGSIKVFSSGFKEVGNDYFKLSYDKNYLVFGDDQVDVNVYNGISRYGPYKPPENTSNIRFMFIFNELDKNLANSLFKYLSRGYKNFPGLAQYAGLSLNLDKDKSIIFKDRENPIPEISAFLEEKPIDKSQRYIAIYISPYHKFDEDEEKQIIYYQVKELLLKNEISSQVIYHENILDPNFNYSLPNIAIGLLAKVGGIPWKLKRERSNFLLIGFGAQRLENGDEFVGNTVCFDNEGVFQEFNTFTSKVDSIGKHIEQSIKSYIDSPKNEDSSISKLVIHYYKEFSGDERDELDRVLKNLDLNIPYVVLTINDNRAKDFICFDPNFKGLMPISGTIVQLQKHREYLLFNNTRYKEYPTTKIDYSFPVKIRISGHKHFDINSNEVIKDLIDEVYQFSRMYWRSVRQKSNPVTVEYSKIIAKMVAHFENNQLPETETAHKTLWFI